MEVMEMIAVKIDGKIRIGDDFVQAVSGKTEHTISKVVRGVEYKVEVSSPVDYWTAVSMVKKLKS
jgi:hypothetical protein